MNDNGLKLGICGIFIFKGTDILLLSARPRDASTKGFVNWPFTSVATWGENPNGVWYVIVADQVRFKN